MKGGRTAPRNLRWLTAEAHGWRSFNEGGADCPPKRVAVYGSLAAMAALQ